jgi:hypothetical protein
MKTMIIVCSMVLLLSVFTGIARGGTEGNLNTFYGKGAGNSTTGDDDYDTFIGATAGYSNTTGAGGTFLGAGAGFANTTGGYNTFLGNGAGGANTTGGYNTFVGYAAGSFQTTGGYNTFVGFGTGRANSGSRNTFLGNYAGYAHTSGNNNTFLGGDAGYTNTTGYANTFLGNNTGRSNTTGNLNVFIGSQAGYKETGSNRLYIANSDTTTPLIYGEFDNRLLTINGNLSVVAPNNGLIRLTDVTTDNTDKSARMVLDHYANAKLPVYIFGAVSTSADNLVAIGGGDKFGSAATKLDFYTAPNPTTQGGTARITIMGNGYVGIGTQKPKYPSQMAAGAYTDGKTWIDVSSREYKEDIKELSAGEAWEAMQELNPVKYTYKADRTERRVGFISEEVPELVAMKDRRGLSAMEIVAVLTKVVQEQQKTISVLSEKLKELEKEVGAKRGGAAAAPSVD